MSQIVLRLATVTTAAVLLAGCPPAFHPANRVDVDGDGFFAPGNPNELKGLTVSALETLEIDCDDSRDTVFPGAAELCDGIDNDCSRAEACYDEEADEYDQFCLAGLDPLENDDDGDGFTECGYIPVEEYGEGEVSVQTDCNDDVDEIGPRQYPGNAEVCDLVEIDGVSVGLDDDCDGSLMEGEVDRDQDGFAEGCDAEGGGPCELPLDETFDSRCDCADDNAEVHPDIEVAFCYDDDFNTDCSENQGGGEGAVLWYPDCDQDGDGDLHAEPLELCSTDLPGSDNDYCAFNGENWLLAASNTADDCDDSDDRLSGKDNDLDGYSTCAGDHYPGLVTADFEAAAFPGACERCDEIDNDLDGDVDNGYDLDGDLSPANNENADGNPGACADPYLEGQPTNEAAAVACDLAYGASGVDCDDGDPGLNRADLDFDLSTTCDDPPDCNDGNPDLSNTDNDGDGFTTCGATPDCDDFDADLNQSDFDGDGFTSCDGDCDDDADVVYPGAVAACDDYADNDCNGTDPNEEDFDGDGASICDGDCNDDDTAVESLDADGDGYTTCGGDCDDGDDTVHPGAPTVCDGVTDNDCNGIADPNQADVDSDGNTICDGDCNDYDAALNLNDAIADGGDGDGWTTCAGDCDDGDASVNPGVDDDADGWDVCGAEGIPGDCDDNDPSANWNDIDGDGSSTCDAPVDCDDNDFSLNLLDEDGDGVTSCAGTPDCDDLNDDVSPVLSEGISADGLDNDCDGTADEGLIDEGDLAVTEMMIGAEPTTTDAFGEYVEVFNAAGHPLDLRGWEVEVFSEGTGGTVTFTFPSGTDELPLSIGTGQRAVIARSTNELGYGYDIADIHWSAAAFSDVGGTLTFSFAGDFVDEVTWSGSGCTANCDPGQFSSVYGNGAGYWKTGHAMSLKEPLIGGAAENLNDNENNWCEERDALGPNDYGSPGTAPSLLGPCG